MRTKFILIILIFIGAACTSGEEKISRKADKLHKEILTVDTHCDTPMRLYRGGFDLGVRNEKGCVDFPRMPYSSARGLGPPRLLTWNT
jgi:membrane dipeptidase